MADNQKTHVYLTAEETAEIKKVALINANWGYGDDKITLRLLSDLEAMRADNVKLRDYYDATHSAAGFGYPESSLRGIESNRDEVIATLAELDRMRKALEDARRKLVEADKMHGSTATVIEAGRILERALNPQPTAGDE